MSSAIHIQTLRCLIIPDIHQNLSWVERVLAKEDVAPRRPDLIVFLGDYFDSHRPSEERATVAATCAWLNAAHERLGQRAVFLLGNHDVQYLEAKPACDRYRTPRHLGTRCGAAFTHNNAKRIARDLSPEFWRAARLFVCVNEWLLSHAGLAPGHWPVGPTTEASLTRLAAQCRDALAMLAPGRPVHPLLQAGRVRGGDAAIGGITWQDWDDEFEDALPLPQIVGHTVNEAGARQRGRSWCLDGNQTCYGVLTPDGFFVSAV